MITRIYLYTMCLVSITACVIFSTIALATIAQDPKPLKTIKTIKFRVDNSFTKDQKKAIGRALKQWEAICEDLKLTWYTDDIPFGELLSWQEDGIATIYNASSRLGWLRHVAQYVTVSNDVLGAALSITGDIFMIDTMPGRFEVVAVHEVGHILLGSYHSTDTNSVMYPTIGLDFEDRRITLTDIARLRKRLGKESKQCFFPSWFPL